MDKHTVEALTWALFIAVLEITGVKSKIVNWTYQQFQ